MLSSLDRDRNAFDRELPDQQDSVLWVDHVGSARLSPQSRGLALAWSSRSDMGL